MIFNGMKYSWKKYLLTYIQFIHLKEEELEEKYQNV